MLKNKVMYRLFAGKNFSSIPRIYDHFNGSFFGRYLTFFVLLFPPISTVFHLKFQLICMTVFLSESNIKRKDHHKVPSNLPLTLILFNISDVHIQYDKLRDTRCMNVQQKKCLLTSDFCTMRINEDSLMSQALGVLKKRIWSIQPKTGVEKLLQAMLVAITPDR